MAKENEQQVATAAEWISAAEAIALLKGSHGDFATRTVIATRAADRLIRSRAQRFIRETPAINEMKEQDNVELPAQFWWARGETALIQNWEVGDFETWIGGMHHWRAYNVEFLKSDIDALLASRQRVAVYAEAAIPKKAKSTSRRIFLVHGHDDGAREAVARFLEKIGFKVVILHEKANQGRTVLEKVEAYSDVGFAVVLLSPDDVGCIKGGTPVPRARQNVLLELGYFIGKLTRQRVCTLKVGEVEIPSDWAGVIDEPYDKTGAWRMILAKELEAAEYDIDWNKVMGREEKG